MISFCVVIFANQPQIVDKLPSLALAFWKNRNDSVYTVTAIAVDGFGNEGEGIGCDINSIVLPCTITRIEDTSFSYCSLTSITIPASVTEIGEYAFSDCTNLALVRIEATAVLIFSETAFADCASGLVFEVPSASLSLYQANAAWSEYTLRGY